MSPAPAFSWGDEGPAAGKPPTCTALCALSSCTLRATRLLEASVQYLRRTARGAAPEQPARVVGRAGERRRRAGRPAGGGGGAPVLEPGEPLGGGLDRRAGLSVEVQVVAPPGVAAAVDEAPRPLAGAAQAKHVLHLHRLRAAQHPSQQLAGQVEQLHGRGAVRQWGSAAVGRGRPSVGAGRALGCAGRASPPLVEGPRRFLSVPLPPPGVRTRSTCSARRAPPASAPQSITRTGGRSGVHHTRADRKAPANRPQTSSAGSGAAPSPGPRVLVPPHRTCASRSR
jgi:hypothetical protein